jgi:hypothetical protein
VGQAVDHVIEPPIDGLGKRRRRCGRGAGHHQKERSQTVKPPGETLC